MNWVRKKIRILFGEIAGGGNSSQDDGKRMGVFPAERNVWTGRLG